MKIQYIYKSKTTHHAVKIIKIHRGTVHYKYMKLRENKEHIAPNYNHIYRISKILFNECFIEDEKLTNLFIIKEIIE